MAQVGILEAEWSHSVLHEETIQRVTELLASRDNLEKSSCAGAFAMRASGQAEDRIG